MQTLSLRFVMLHGVAGAGKSSLAEGLSAVLMSQGARVDLIPEEDIFTRNEFIEVGQEFKTGDGPSADMMLAAYDRILALARDQKAWVITDWDCVGMIEDLPWAQLDRATLATFQSEARADMDVLTAHACDVRLLAADLRPILLILSVPYRVAVMRAAAERGQEWIERYAALVQELRAGEPLIDRIIRWYDSTTPHYIDIVNAYMAAGWEVAEVDATPSRDDVLHEVMNLLFPEASIGHGAF